MNSGAVGLRIGTIGLELDSANGEVCGVLESLEPDRSLVVRASAGVEGLDEEREMGEQLGGVEWARGSVSGDKG